MNILVAIDIQKGWVSPTWGRRNNPRAEEAMDTLLTRWRESGIPVVHIQHLSSDSGSPLHPSSDGVAFMGFATPRQGEAEFRKNVNSAFIGTGLLEHLRALKPTALTFIGFTTDHCISTSVRMAANLGFISYVVENATATFDRMTANGKKLSAESIHESALASLHNEFATVIDTIEALEKIL